MNFIPDTRWNAFDQCKTFEDFEQSVVPEIYLKPQVHNDIKKAFALVKSLIEYSYYNYEFYDEAALRAMITLEMAVNIRAKELNISFKPYASLKLKLKEFYRLDYLEVYNTDYLDHIRKVRNHLVHLNNYGVGGPGLKHLITNPLNLINDLYEDPNLRRKRKVLQKSIFMFMENVTQTGRKLQIGNDVFIIYEAWLHVNNKVHPNEINFYALPIHSNNMISAGTGQPTVSVIKLQSTKMYYRDGKLIFSNEGINLFTISKLDDEESRTAFDNWLSDFEASSQFPSIRFNITRMISQSFENFMNEFYRME